MKQSVKNKFIIACAGSGKTTRLIKECFDLKDKKILFTTYTNENLEQIREYFYSQNGFVPTEVGIQSWFSFLLQDGVRPYQNLLSTNTRVRSIYFQQKLNRFHKKENYFTVSNDIFSNKLAEFVYECNKSSNGNVIKRLEKIYDYILIDEIQDLAGYDLLILEMLINSRINLIGVGDPRQSTFSTNSSSKNKNFRKEKIINWLKNKQEEGAIEIEEMNNCKRSNSIICSFADKLCSDYGNSISGMDICTGHDGVFAIHLEELDEYIKKYNPIILKYNKKSNTSGYKGLNMGASKGKTFDRVIIFPTKGMMKYLTSGDLKKFKDVPKFYVAVTRARYSVTFILSKQEIKKFEDIWVRQKVNELSELPLW